MLLNMICQLGSVRLFQRLNSLIVTFKLFELLFEFLTSVVEAFFKISELGAHLRQFSLMITFDFLFFFIYHALVTLESSLRAGALINMRLFQCGHLIFPMGASFGFVERIFLLGDNSVSRVKQLFDFALVSIRLRSVELIVLFSFAMQVEDHFCQLCDLLRHLVVRFFAWHFLCKLGKVLWEIWIV